MTRDEDPDPAPLTFPGVFIDEIPPGHTIEGVPTSTAAFVGRAWRGPVDQPTRISSFAEFERLFGGLWGEAPMSYAIEHAFAEWRARGDRRARDERRIGGGVHGRDRRGSAPRTGDAMGPQPATHGHGRRCAPPTRGNSTSRSPMTRPLGWTSGGSAAAAWPRRPGRVGRQRRCTLRRCAACRGVAPAAAGRRARSRDAGPGAARPCRRRRAGRRHGRRRRRHRPRGRRARARDPRVRRGGRLRPARHPTVRARCRRRAGDMGRGRSGLRGAQVHRPRRCTGVVGPDAIEAELATWELPRANAALYYPRLLAAELSTVAGSRRSRHPVRSRA